MKKKLISICAIVIVLLGCNGGGNKGTNKVRVGYLPIAECLPLYVAKEKGYFEKHGLEVELISASGGPVIFKELEAGTIDIGFSNVVSLIKQNNSGKEYVSLFGATYETTANINHGMFSQRGYDTSKMSRIKFGVNARNNIEELMLLSYLKKKGVTINEDVLKNITDIPFPQMLPALRDKTIEVACIVEPFITIAKNDTTSFSFIGNHYPADGTNKILVATYVTKKTYTQKEKESAKSFIEAMKDATNEINNTTNNLRDLILRYCKLDPALLDKISLSLFENKANADDLDKIMRLMYDSVLNRNKNFIPNPNKKIDVKTLIYN